MIISKKIENKMSPEFAAMTKNQDNTQVFALTWYFYLENSGS